MHLIIQKVDMMYTKTNIAWKKVCDFLKEYAMKITIKNEMVPLTCKVHISYLPQTNCHICKKEFKKYIQTNLIKLEIIVIIEVNREVLHIIFVIYELKNLL